MADDFFAKVNEEFGITYSQENLEAQIKELFYTFKERKEFSAFCEKE